MKSNQFNRRQFLRSAVGATLSAAVLPAIVPASALGRDGKVAPSNRITVGCIGVGPQGQGVMSNFLNQQDARVVAVCDTKADQLQQARNKVNEHYKNDDCATCRDFRELVSRNDIDACLIATPDHWHVLTALAAVRANKDVYVEKPLAPTLAEGQALRREVQRRKRIFQFGTQQRSSRTFRLACELVRNARIGKLKHINVWAPGSAPGGSTKVVPVPPGLDFELWTGPAPLRPYTENLCSADGALKTWWYISDYALGFISGWGIHPMDIALWGGGDLLSGPIEVQGRGSFRAHGACDTATIWDINFRFGSGVTMTFIGTPNGRNRAEPTNEPWLYHDEWKERYRRITTHGTAFEGRDGWVHVDREGINLHPEALIEENADSFSVKLRRSPAHVRNFLDCVKSRAQPVCPIEDALRADATCHVADIGIRLGRKVVYDPIRERFIKDEEANRRLALREVRKPWRI